MNVTCLLVADLMDLVFRGEKWFFHQIKAKGFDLEGLGANVRKCLGAQNFSEKKLFVNFFVLMASP